MGRNNSSGPSTSLYLPSLSLFLPLSRLVLSFCAQLLLKTKVAKAVASTGPRKGQALKALLGFHSSKADGMLYGMSPAEGCFFRWKMVRKCCCSFYCWSFFSATKYNFPLFHRRCIYNSLPEVRRGP